VAVSSAAMIGIVWIDEVGDATQSISDCPKGNFRQIDKLGIHPQKKK
jgi:hypothetical protein